MSTLTILSQLTGWDYVISWGFSFYPLIYNIYRQKSSEGLKLDYICLNISGYIFLCAYSTAGFMDDSLGVGTVEIGDLVFCYNGVVMTSVSLAMYFYYPHGENKLDIIAKYMLVILWTLTIGYFTFTWFYHPLLGVNIWQFMGYEKVFITLTKYVPQVYWNYVRKNTDGWSVWASFLDLNGGIMSFVQAIIDKYNDGRQINMVKTLLGFITMFYDVILITQCYVIYPKRKQRLLRKDEISIQQQSDEITKDKVYLQDQK